MSEVMIDTESYENYCIDFCLVCGLHMDYCENPTCKLDHCKGITIFCTKDQCYCDKTQFDKCRYQEVIDENKTHYNDQHIIKFSKISVQWCNECGYHHDCMEDSCIHKHCAC